MSSGHMRKGIHGMGKNKSCSAMNKGLFQLVLPGLLPGTFSERETADSLSESNWPVSGGQVY